MKPLPHEITIFHTNDFHGKLSSAGAAHLKLLKSSTPNSILLDSGDAIKTGNLGIPIKEEPVWKLFKVAGYDAMTLGNRETHINETAFEAKLKGAPCPILCANLIDKKKMNLPVFPSINLLIGEIEVCIVGVSVPMVTSKMKTQIFSRYLWEQPINVAKEQAELNRSKCDLLIALTHIGFRNDNKLAEAVPAYDIIIGGHSHTLIEPQTISEGPLIVQAGSHGKWVGKIVINKAGEMITSILPLNN